MFFYPHSQCVTVNNLILCSAQDELNIVTAPISTGDATIASQNMKMAQKIEQIRVLFESPARSIVAVRMDNAETKIYELTKAEATGAEWNFKELNIPAKTHMSYSVTTEKNTGRQMILEAQSTEQKLNFHVSTVNDQSLSNTRSYTVELPENMGGIEYLFYSTVKQTQLVTLRMQDGSLLVIKLVDNGGTRLILLKKLLREKQNR